MVGVKPLSSLPTNNHVGDSTPIFGVDPLRRGDRRLQQYADRVRLGDTATLVQAASPVLRGLPSVKRRCRLRN